MKATPTAQEDAGLAVPGEKRVTETAAPSEHPLRRRCRCARTPGEQSHVFSAVFCAHSVTFVPFRSIFKLARFSANPSETLISWVFSSLSARAENGDRELLYLTVSLPRSGSSNSADPGLGSDRRRFLLRGTDRWRRIVSAGCQRRGIFPRGEPGRWGRGASWEGGARNDSRADSLAGALWQVPGARPPRIV
jgi:hypothetical protein